MSLRVTGGAQLQRNLDELSKRMSNQIKRAALIKAAEPIRLSMAQKAPRAPGAPDLADNIIIDASPRGRGIYVAIGPAKEFPYGFYQEFGTIHHGIQAFARPAFDADAPRAIPILTGAISRELIQRGFAGTRGSGGGVGV